MGVAQKEDEEESIDQQDIFYCVVPFLATITCFLFTRVLGADDPPFRPVMGTRGEAGAVAGPATPGAGPSTSADRCTVSPPLRVPPFIGDTV